MRSRIVIRTLPVRFRAAARCLPLSAPLLLVVQTERLGLDLRDARKRAKPAGRMGGRRLRQPMLSALTGGAVDARVEDEEHAGGQDEPADVRPVGGGKWAQ